MFYHFVHHLVLLKVSFTEYWFPTDMKFYGRCHTFNPSTEILKSGIFWMEMFFKTKVRVFVHNHGVLRTVKTARSQFHDISVNTRHMINVEHNLYKMLDFEGTPCISSEKWNLDECIISQLETRSLKEFGCVTPFSNLKEHICETQTQGK